MKTEIYQINDERDKKFFRFCGTPDLIERGEYDREKNIIDSSIYDKIYSFDTPSVPSKYGAEINLNDIYTRFNMFAPRDFFGCSMSVSDIIRIQNSAGKWTAFLVDNLGFTKVNFDAAKTKEVGGIDVMYLEPEKEARIIKVPQNLDCYQRLVDGNVEPLYLDDDLIMCCNEEGKMRGMKLNRAIYDEDKNIVEVIVGAAFICKDGGETFESLSKDKQTKCFKDYGDPQTIIKLNGKITAIPYKEEPEQKRGAEHDGRER